MKRAGPSLADENIECPVCYLPAVMPVTLPNCRHKVCYICMKGVTQTGRPSACPYCRTRVDERFLKTQVQQISIYGELPRNYRAYLASMENGDEEEEEEEEVDVKPDLNQLKALVEAGNTGEDHQNPSSQDSTGESSALKPEDGQSDSTTEETEPAPSAFSDHGANCKKHHYWLYGRRKGGWWRYEPRDEAAVEHAYRTSKTKKEKILLAFGQYYIMDFNNWIQYKEGDEDNARCITCLHKSDMKHAEVIGIAGVRTANVWTLD
uniref:E3 ubiquitin-protein ligase n=1 Tax=Caenorhabditis tropicalis TaxID=1561998 RepID=A0A1I7TND9_9PELO